MKKTLILALLFPFLGHAQIITTIAGDGTAGYSGDGGTATAAMINHPIGIATDTSGNIYFADYNNNCIRKINTSGIVYTIAGNGMAGYSGDGGLATDAELNGPYGVAFDAMGNLFISDNNNSCIRKVNVATGIITTIAGNGIGGYSGDGGPATAAQLRHPALINMDIHGNLYIADQGNQRIRKINTSGIVTTIAGNGTEGYLGDGGIATAAELNFPFGVWVDSLGNVYIADAINNAVRKVNTSGIISSIAGNGTAGFSGDGGLATMAQVTLPQGITMDKFGNIYFSDSNNRIRKIDTSGIVTTIAGNGINDYAGDGGLATLAEFNGINGLCFNSTGNILYIADVFNSRIREINYTSLSVNSIKNNTNQISLYPNPNTGTFTIKGSLNTVANEPVALSIINVLGQVVGYRNITSQSGSINTQMIMGNDIPGGIYYLQIKSATENEVCRFEIEK